MDNIYCSIIQTKSCQLAMQKQFPDIKIHKGERKACTENVAYTILNKNIHGVLIINS